MMKKYLLYVVLSSVAVVTGGRLCAVWAENDDFSKASKIVQSFQAEPFSGASSTALPILVPAARKNLQPQLGVHYSSTAGNGWLGAGWDFDLGYIERQTTNGIPRYTSGDTLVISSLGINSTLVASADYPDEFYPASTSHFIKFFFRGTYWEAADKDGRSYLFGQAPGSRIDTPQGTFRWALCSIRDTCGNVMTITYVREGNQLYPSRIDYNGNQLTSEPPTHRVEFIWEARQDEISSFRSGYEIVTAKRLREIKTFVGSQLVNRYLFEYGYSRQTSRSLLQRFTCFGKDGVTSLPAIEFTYEDAQPPAYKISSIDAKTGDKRWCIDKAHHIYGNATGALFPSAEGLGMCYFSGGGRLFWENNVGFNTSGEYWAVDNKGKLSVTLAAREAFHAWTYVYVETAKSLSFAPSGSGNFFVWLNADYSAPVNPQQVNLKQGPNLIELTGYNMDGPCVFDLNYALSDNVSRMHSHQHLLPHLSGDFNGDGRMDLATYFSSTGQINVAFSNGDSFQPAETWPIRPSNNFFPKYMNADKLNLVLGNFDDNYLTDIWGFNASGQAELLTTWSKLFTDEGGGGPALFPVTGTPFGADFNGDGRTDIGLQAQDSNDIIIALCDQYQHFPSITTWLAHFPGEMLVGDFNGDGMTDVAAYDSAQGKVSVALNKGNAFAAPQEWIAGFSPAMVPAVSDCNGDGAGDLCYYDRQSGQMYAACSDGKKFLAPAVFLSGFSLNEQDMCLQSSDFNGDGASDFYIYNPFTQKTEIAYSGFAATDLLAEARNGIGGKARIRYALSSHYDNTITDALRQSDFEYQYLRGNGLPFTVPVVKEVAVSDGMGNTLTSSYDYAGGFFDPNDRQMRGFGSVTVTDVEGNQEEIYFKQDDVYKGRPYRQEYRDKNGALYLKVEKQWGYQTMGAGSNGAGKYVFLAAEKRYAYDGGPSAKLAQSSFGYSYAYEGSGSPRQIAGDLINTNEGGDATLADTSSITYTQPENGRGIISKPAFMYRKNGYRATKQWLYYDNHTDYTATPGKGLLTGERVYAHPTETSASTDNTSQKVSVTAYGYDAYGNRTSVTDPNMRTTTTVYDPQYHLWPVELVNALGQRQRFSYDVATGKVLTSTDANNQVTTYEYDALGRLKKVIGPNDTVQYPRVSYEYDTSACPVRVTRRYKTTHANAYAVEYSFYDGLGRLIEVKSAAADEPGTGRPQQVVKGVVTFDSRGKTKEKYKPYFVAASDAYVPPDNAQPKTTFDYDCLGRPVKVTHPDSTCRTIAYANWVVTTIDAKGHQMRSTYDALSRLVKQEEFNQGEVYVTAYNYDEQQFLYDPQYILRRGMNITDHAGNVTHIYYDGLGRKEKIIDPDMGTWYYGYDKAGNLIQQKDALGQVLAFEYDALNRLKKKAYPDGKTIVYAYDDPAKQYCVGRLSYVVEASGRADYFYNNLGEQVKESRSIDGQAYTFERAYNPLGQVTGLTYPDGEIVTYSYNHAGSMERVAGPAAAYVSGIDYAATGQIAKMTFGNGVVTEYAYDPQSFRLTDVKTAGGSLQNMHYLYDNVGNIEQILDYRNGASQDFQYDDLNRLKQAAGVYGAFQYQYDPIGNLTYKEGVTCSYGQGSSKPHAITSASDGFSAAYDANGNLTLRNDAVLTYDYDNRLIKFETKYTDQPVGLDVNLSAGWNFITLPFIVNDGRIAAVLSSIAGKYDQVSRFNPATAKSEHYVVGRPEYTQFTTMETGKGYQVYITEPQGCILRLTGRVPVQNYGISLKTGWQMIGYPAKSKVRVGDGLANLVKGTHYDRIATFDKAAMAFVELSAMDYLEPGRAYFIRMRKDATWTVLPKQDIIEFAYDADGNRLKKSTADSTVLYLGEFFEIETEVGSQKTEVRKHIFAGANRVATVSVSLRGPSPQAGAEAICYYHPDHLGSSNVITDDSGAQVERYEYTPYGSLAFNSVIASPATAGGEACLPAGRQSFVSHLFTGKELDSTGLYYYGARYYDPRIGRFLQVDPIAQNIYDPQTLNPYAYCRNNPLNLIDPTGESWEDSWSSWTQPVASSWDDSYFSSFDTSYNNSYSTYAGVNTTAIGSTLVGTGAIVTQLDSPLPGPMDVVGVGLIGLGVVIGGQDAANAIGGAFDAVSNLIAQALWGMRNELNTDIHYAVREAERNGGEIQEGEELTPQEAADRVAKGGDVVADSEAEARDIATRAGSGEDPVHDSPHDQGGQRQGDYRPHYHPNGRDGGHVFYPREEEQP